MSEDYETFYFIMHPRGDETKIQVCDLSYVCSYEKRDWMDRT